MVYSYCLYIFYPAELQPVYEYFLYKCQVNYTLLDPPFLSRFTSQGNKNKASRFQFIKQISRLYFYRSLQTSLYYIVYIKVPRTIISPFTILIVCYRSPYVAIQGLLLLRLQTLIILIQPLSIAIYTLAILELIDQQLYAYILMR